MMPIASISTPDPCFKAGEPLMVNGYLYLPAQSDKSPEHRLIDLCRELRAEDDEIVRISFRLDREDGCYQTASFGCANVTAAQAGEAGR